jgi:hypothetical protein
VQAIGYHAIKAGFVVLYRSIFDVVRDFLQDEALDQEDKILARTTPPGALRREKTAPLKERRAPTNRPRRDDSAATIRVVPLGATTISQRTPEDGQAIAKTAVQNATNEHSHPGTFWGASGWYTLGRSVTSRLARLGCCLRIASSRYRFIVRVRALTLFGHTG